MRKSPILLAGFLLVAVGASAPKQEARLRYDPGAGADGPHEAVAESDASNVSGYPPCSRLITDRCIQLYERRVRLALPPRPRAAMGGPIEGNAAYPHCSRLITDECVQLFDRAPRPARAAPRRARPVSPQSEPSTPGI
ncbi:MAG TPA: hypothetical protein VEW25_04470 [Allosphingosinicella sp.]|nr:hypothetical protein [Allosphingosinicella sp.]